MHLLRNGENLAALLNVGAHLVLALTAVWLGGSLAHWIWR
jgi:fluoride ion exporter CrcB/FEX